MPDSTVQDSPPASPLQGIASSRTASSLPGALAARSQLRTLSSNEIPVPPFHILHVLHSLPNFRDIGGWPIISTDDSPKHVRTNLIYRGPDTTRISLEDIAALQDLGIATDYDLRSAGQIAKLGFRDLSEYGIRRVWCPVFSDEDMKAEEEGVNRRYEQYASDDVSVRPPT